jgi:uncharacterized protein (DUF1697 family)
MISVALLRGVNVGGNHKIPMADLTQWLLAAGFVSASTYIQSGNVILEHAARVKVATIVGDAITKNTGWKIPVLVRSSSELSRVVEANPYPGAEPSRLHVSFLDSAPDETSIAAASRDNWDPEEYTVDGREIYLHLPEGMGRSVMVPKLKLLKGATTRNWNTVLALTEMADR